jgi:hypothetical protein
MLNQVFLNCGSSHFYWYCKLSSRLSLEQIWDKMDISVPCFTLALETLTNDRHLTIHGHHNPRVSLVKMKWKSVWVIYYYQYLLFVFQIMQILQNLSAICLKLEQFVRKVAVHLQKVLEVMSTSVDTVKTDLNSYAPYR